MIPRLSRGDSVAALYRQFLGELLAGRFAGEVRADYATRLVAATDNSVYQIVPEAVIFPRSRDDVVAIGLLAGLPRYRSIRLTPRGAGTGTTGASLSAGLAVDLSKYMNRILEFDAARGLVRVEPGVVLDQLNAYLEPHGVFFAPHVAPSDRATLGGMISNDSCGKGSRLYGRTSRHIESLEIVLADGSTWRSALLPANRGGDDGLPPRIARARQVVAEMAREHAGLIADRFPMHDRFLSGYDLAHAVRPGGEIDLGAIVAGSEGTLAVVVEAELRVTPIPANKRLVAIAYESFDAALLAADDLLACEPAAIETIDENLLALARTDMVGRHIAGRMATLASARALHLVELCDSDANRLASRVAAVLSGAAAAGAIGAHDIDNDEEARAFWALRARAVGLLGNMSGARRPVPFVEDCAVPPRRLAQFVASFRAILDEYGLSYGMYGHVDVGCLHVRPALDMRDVADARLLRTVSDRVFRLVRNHGGVFWGEHGKGMRSEYNPEVFGPVLYEQIQRIKQAFDPHNQMNPGKIATPTSSGEPLVTLDAPTRGDRDRDIAAGAQATYAGAIACNGNGACFSWDVDRPMCPSLKITADRVHSPKGRAAVMREWLRQLSILGWEADGRLVRSSAAAWFDPLRRLRRLLSPSDFSHEVYAAFSGCLSCKACVAHCPVHVDIPGFKADFLHAYHQRYPRSLADFLVAAMESALPRASRHARAYNRCIDWVPAVIPALLGLVDPPPLAPMSAERCLRDRGAEFVEWGGSITATDATGGVALLPDAFTNFFAPHILVELHDLLRGRGARVVVLPYRASGKSHHVKGFLHEFRTIALRNAEDLSRLAGCGFAVVCVEPAVALLFRQEYRMLGTGSVGDFHVALPQEWLAANLPLRKPTVEKTPYILLSHCTEATTAAVENEQWRTVFESAGLSLEIPPLGCCGMAGAYGHEAKHREQSRGIFEQSWGRRIGNVDPSRLLATGQSCRSQVARFAGVTPRHPVEILAECQRRETR